MPSKKKAEEAPGAPLWMVTFSDMITNMLCFFVLLLSFSTVSEKDFKDAMESIQASLLGLSGGQPAMVGTTGMPGRERRSEAEAARRLRTQLQILGQEKQVNVEYDAMGGLKINLPDAILFEAGSVDLKPESFPLFRAIAEVLADMPDAFIEVRGHTDDRPTGESPLYRDNFQLSFLRADAVARRLYTAGNVPKEQFEITALGANQPVASNATDEGRAANRRVEIYVRGFVDKTSIESLGTPDSARGQEAPLSGTAVSPREFSEVE